MIKFKPVKVKTQGFVTYRVERADRSVRLQGPTERQLIVNDGLNDMPINFVDGLSRYCRVGTGNTPPAETQTDLDSTFGASSGQGGNTVTSNSGAFPWWHAETRDYTFSAGTVDGAALAELGFFAASSGGNMFSRLLFLDGGGAPTTITLLPDEILIVSYEIRQYVPTADVVGTFDVDEGGGSPVTYNYTLRPSNADSESSWGIDEFNSPTATAYETDVLGAQDGAPSGTSSGMSLVENSYVDSSYQSEYSTSATLGQANFVTGIGSMVLGVTRSRWQASFSPKLPKDNTKTLNFSNFLTVAWDRGTP